MRAISGKRRYRALVVVMSVQVSAMCMAALPIDKWRCNLAVALLPSLMACLAACMPMDTSFKVSFKLARVPAGRVRWALLSGAARSLDGST